MEELKPCPFCGNTYDVKVRKNPYGDTWNVHHDKCGIHIGFGYSHTHPKTKEEAIELWNKRSDAE